MFMTVVGSGAGLSEAREKNETENVQDEQEGKIGKAIVGTPGKRT